MPNYLVGGTIHMESTGEEAMYEVEMEDWDHLPDPISILEHLVQSGEIQIIPSYWEEVED
ncbi:MAG: hypothetical protein EB168_07315 [Euryarchaeota archaeon]|nr:hypothetical protein [Euryarchaeota archaeon]